MVLLSDVEGSVSESLETSLVVTILVDAKEVSDGREKSSEAKSVGSVCRCKDRLAVCSLFASSLESKLVQAVDSSNFDGE